MISRVPSKAFVASGQVDRPPAGLLDDPLYVFATQSSPMLADLDEEGANLVILSNGSDVAGLYRRAAGPSQTWQRLIQWLPSASRSASVVAAREMDRWMFEHRSATSILDRIAVGHEQGSAFLEEVGARLVGQDEFEAVYLTAGAVQ